MNGNDLWSDANKKNFQAVRRCYLGGYGVQNDPHKKKQPLGTCTYVILLSYYTRVLAQPEKQGQKSHLPSGAPVANAINDLQACIYKSVKTGLFSKSFVATSGV